MVERTFAWLSFHRRLSKDYERLPETSEAFIRIFVFDAPPEPLDEDVIQGSTSPVHTDGDLALFEYPGERATDELRALVSVEDLRPRYL